MGMTRSGRPFPLAAGTDFKAGYAGWTSPVGSVDSPPPSSGRVILPGELASIVADGCNLIAGDSHVKKSRLHLHFMWGEHDPGSFRAQPKSAEEPAKPGREVNLQLLANTQRFLQGSLLAASMPRFKVAPAIRVQARDIGPWRVVPVCQFCGAGGAGATAQTVRSLLEQATAAGIRGW
jgi:hypothetical protein